MMINKTFFKRRAVKSTLIIASAFTVFSLAAFGESTSSNNAISKNNEGKTETAKDTVESVFNARYVFEKLHTSALEILPGNTRLDMLDYWDVDSVYKASNAMEGLSWLETVTPDYLKVKITSVSSLEIKILPLKKDKIVMTIYTVGDEEQAQDSQVKFYDESLTEVASNKFLVMPEVKDFFEIPRGSATKMKEIEDMIPFPTIAFAANPDNDNLEARLTVEQYINQDDWNIAKLFAKPKVTLEWQKGKYKYKK